MGESIIIIAFLTYIYYALNGFFKATTEYFCRETEYEKQLKRDIKELEEENKRLNEIIKSHLNESNTP